MRLGIKMVQVPVVCLFAALFVAGCDFMGTSEIEIINESSHNLCITFQSKYAEFGDIYIDKDAVASCSLKAGNYIPDPNYDVRRLTFIDSDNGEIIKETGNTKHLFTLTRTRSKEFRKWYQLVINDELLSIEL